MKKSLKAVILIPYVSSNEGADVPLGEAKYLYEDHFKDAEIFQVSGQNIDGRLYVKDDIGMYIVGISKISAAYSTTALLNYDHFDFSNAKFYLFGCCGASCGTAVPGDIFVITHCCDFELGYHADIRDKEAKSGQTWFPKKSLEVYGNIPLDKNFSNSIYEKIKDAKPPTTEHTKDFMARSFNNADWAMRDPVVLKGASITSDSYWKGSYDHQAAQYICNYYKCEDPYVATDMEDIAVAKVFQNHEILDRLAIIRYGVNTDVFMEGQTPEKMWEREQVSNSSDGFDDLFDVSTKFSSDLLWDLIN